MSDLTNLIILVNRRIELALLAFCLSLKMLRGLEWVCFTILGTLHRLWEWLIWLWDLSFRATVRRFYRSAIATGTGWGGWEGASEDIICSYLTHHERGVPVNHQHWAETVEARRACSDMVRRREEGLIVFLETLLLVVAPLLLFFCFQLQR